MVEREVDVLIVGGGVAGVRCARTLRRRRFDGAILLVGSEPVPPYNRPPLSKELLRGEVPLELVAVEQPDWYERQRVELWTDATVASLDPAAHRVILADGRILRYGRCVLATGARPRRPPLPGAEHALLLRTLGDAEALRAKASAGSRVVIVGGGFIGVEVASSLVARGAGVTLLVRSDRLYGGAIGEELSAWALERLRGAGVAVRLMTSASRIEPDGVRVGDEVLAADLVLAGVGVSPAVELGLTAGVAVDDGVSVSDRQETTARDLFAVGDVAAAPHPLAGGKRIRVEHWHAARESGERAALAMLGGELPPRRAPWVFSEVAGHALDVVGWAPDWDTTLVLGDPESDSWALAFLRGGRVAQLGVVGGFIEVEAARSFVERGGAAVELAQLR